MTTRYRRHSPWMLGITAVMVVCLGAITTQAAWPSGSVSNATSNVAAGTLAFTHTYQSGTTCTLGTRTTTPATNPCTGTLGPTAQVPATGSTTTTDSVTNNGNLTASQLSATIGAASCAPVKYANATTSSDPMLPRFFPSFGQSDPWSTTSATSFDSSNTGYAADVTSNTLGGLLGSTFSIGTWFKVANGYTSGGGLLTFDTSSYDATSAAGSPLLWMDNTGHVRFRITGTLGTSSSGTSSSAFNDGSWHLAVLTVTTVATSSITLYVDTTTAQATAGGLTLLSSGSGYWHAGWGDFTGVTGAPTSAHLNGSLSGAFIRGAATSTTDLTALKGAASAAAYKTAVTGLTSVSGVWMLDDAGTTTYTGTVPGVTTPCGTVDIGIATTSPASTPIATGTKLSTAFSGTYTIAVPAPGTTQTLTVTTSRDASWAAAAAGLRLYVPLTHKVTSAPGTGWQGTFPWSTSAGVFVP